MVRFLLALLLSMVAVAAPVHACSYEAPQAESCCCEMASDSSDCAELSSACCDISEKTPAVPAQQQDQTFVPVVLGRGITPDSTIASRADSVFTRAAESKPIHLATNKVYLERRRLLI